MADIILGGDFTIYYSSENRRKQIVWTGSATGTRTVNQLYSALQDHFDELTQMDDGVPMSAQTPTEYTIGIIDAGDKDPWFIDRTTVEHLTGGALKTASWDRVDGTNTGVVRMAYTIGTDFDETDIGRDILMTTDADRGTILDFNTTGATKYVWIRPDSNAVANSFNDAPTSNGAFTVPNDSLGQVWQVVASGPTYVDETTDANSAGANDWTFFPAGANADYATVGFFQKFKKIIVNVGTAGAGTYTVTWQYWNGAWANLSGVSDGTNAFKNSGSNNVTFTVPTDWIATSINGSPNLFYIRALKDTGSVTTAPLGTQGFIGSYGAGNQAGGAAISGGESLWSNIYTLGTLEDYTHIYIFQNTGNLLAYKGTTDWWSDKTTGLTTDHVDILVCVKELGTEIDEGYIKVYARQYSKTYSYYTVDLTSGGRNPIPLQTGNDLDNQTGIRTFTGSSGVSDFDAGNFIYVGATWATATKRGKLTAVGGTVADPVLTYYLLGDPITDFAASDAVKEYTGTADGDGTCTAGAPSNAGPANLGTPPTITFGGLANGGSQDIDENGTAENYSITMDCNQNSLANVYQWTKYVTRRGSTVDIDSGSQTIEGQFYLGSDYRIVYTTLSGTISDGETVTGASSGATGVVVNHNTTDKILILRNSRGTFTNGEQINQGADNVTGTTITAITPIAAAPMGTFAGGKFFVAPGIVLTDYNAAADANNFQLVDDEGVVRIAPTKATITVSNTRSGDKVAVFRLTGSGGDINKTEYNATAQSIGATTAVMGSTITNDSPGKTAGGVIRLVDTSANTEYRIRFSSWSGTTFTLASSTSLTADAGTNTTTIVDSSTFTNSKVGDIVRNITRGVVTYITVVTDNNTVTVSPAVTGQTTGDSLEINTLPVATTTSPQDTWYVPFIDSYETTGSDGTPGTETVTINHAAADPDIYIRVRARRSSTTPRILPFEQDSSVVGTNPTNVSVIRTSDTIFQ